MSSHLKLGKRKVLNDSSISFYTFGQRNRILNLPGLTSFTETLALFFIQFLSFQKMKVQDRQNGSSGLPEKTGWLRASTVLKMFIRAVLIVFKFLFRCSYLNRSWPAVSRDDMQVFGAMEVQFLLATEFLDVRIRYRVWICICSQNILIIR